MPTRAKVGIILLVVLFGSIIVGVGLRRVMTQSSFNIIFRYGCAGGKNILNTFNGTFTKDMVNASSITTSLTLTQDELKQIYSKIAEVGFFSLDESDLTRLNNTSWCGVSPLVSYYLKVENGTSTRELSWNYEMELNLKSYAPLENLTELIRGIVQSHPEYRMLPEPTIGYY